MRLKVTSWNGHLINDGTNYESVISPGNAMPISTPNFIDMGESFPLLTGKTLGLGYFTFHIVLRGNVETQRDELNKWFDVSDPDYGILLAEDLDTGDDWYLTGTPVAPPMLENEKISKYSISLALKTPYWTTDLTEDTEFNIGSATETNTVAAVGNSKTLPIITISPRYEKGVVSYKHRFFVAVHPPSIETSDINNVKPRTQTIPVDLTPSGWDTAAIVLAGDMLPSGDDVKVVVNGLETPRWFGGGGINDADTHVWSYLTMPSYTKMLLKTSMDNTTTPSEIVVECLGFRTAEFDRVPGTLLTGSELITYTGISVQSINVTPQWATWRITFTGLVRGVHESSKATHSIDDEVHHIANEVWVIYNNPDADAPDGSINDKPPFDLATSTNTEWIYDGAFSVTGASNPLSHSLTPVYNGPGTVYTNTENDGSLEGNFSDPWEVIGLKLKSIMVSGIVYSDTSSKPMWSLIASTPIDSIEYEGQRYRSGALGGTAYVGYPGTGKFGGIVQLAVLALPSAAETWEPFTDTVNFPDTAITTFIFSMSGGLGTTLPLAEALVEINYLKLTVRYPVEVFTPTAVINTSYTLSGYIENSNNDHKITFRDIPMLIDMVLTIDCENMTAEMSDGRDMRPYLQFDGAVREQWMELEPGNNSIVFYDAETSDVDVTFFVDGKSTI